MVLIQIPQNLIATHANIKGRYTMEATWPVRIMSRRGAAFSSDFDEYNSLILSPGSATNFVLIAIPVGSKIAPKIEETGEVLYSEIEFAATPPKSPRQKMKTSL